MFDRITENDRDWDDELIGAKYIARTPGCGCCSGWIKLTESDLDEYIAELKAKIEEAESIRSKL